MDSAANVLDLATVLQRLAVSDQQTDQSHPAHFVEPKKAPIVDRYFSAPAAMLVGSNFNNRTPRIPLGFAYKFDSNALIAFSIDSNTMQVVVEIGCSRGYIETRSIGTVELTKEDLASDRISRIESSLAIAEFVFIHANSDEFTILHCDIQTEDLTLRSERHKFRRLELKSPAQLLKCCNYMVALCADGYIRTWPLNSDEMERSTYQYSRICHIEGVENAVAAIDERRGCVDLFDVEQCRVEQSDSYLPSVGAMFEETKQLGKNAHQPAVRAWAWSDFSGEAKLPFTFSWMFVTKSMWHMHLASRAAYGIIHKQLSHAPPIAATVDSDHDALLVYSEDEGIAVYDGLGAKRMIIQRIDGKVSQLSHGRCEIACPDDGPVCMLMPSGWSTLYYMAGCAIPEHPAQQRASEAAK